MRRIQAVITMAFVFLTFLTGCTYGSATNPQGAGRGVGTKNSLRMHGPATSLRPSTGLGAAGGGAGRSITTVPGKMKTGAGPLMGQGTSTLNRVGRTAMLRPPKKTANGGAGLMGALGLGKGKTKTAAPKKVASPMKPSGKGSLSVIGFVTNDNTHGPMGSPGLKSLASHTSTVSYLSPLWFSVKADGSLIDKSNPKVIAFAKAHKIPIVPLVNNHNGNAGVLMNASARELAVSNITAAAQRHGFNGVSVDFQLLPSTARVGLNTFMDLLSSKIRASGKIVTVNIIPTDAQTGNHGAYDEHTLARYADQVILMTYDHHDNTSKPGPVSPHTWVVNSVRHAIQAGVPAHKIYLGVNTYGYDWNRTAGSAMTIPTRQAKAMHGSKVMYDAMAKESHVQYTKNGAIHVVWFGTDKSLADKVAIAKKFGLHGIAIWQVGFEDKAFWTTLGKLNGAAPRGLKNEPFNSAIGRKLKPSAMKSKSLRKPMVRTAVTGKQRVATEGAAGVGAPRKVFRSTGMG